MFIRPKFDNRSQFDFSSKFPSKSPVKTMYSLFQETNREIVELPPT